MKISFLKMKRMEMTDIEKRRIYNRILLDSEEEQEEQSCDEQKSIKIMRRRSK